MNTTMARKNQHKSSWRAPLDVSNSTEWLPLDSMENFMGWPPTAVG
jgi:hypothetical protein